jgi:hypothetical protein
VKALGGRPVLQAVAGFKTDLRSYDEGMGTVLVLNTGK